VVSVPSDFFDARACEGALPLEGLPESLLYFRVVPVRVRETTVALDHKAATPTGTEGGRLGLTVDTATMAVTCIRDDGLLAVCGAEQLLEAKRPKCGDYLIQVNGISGTADELLAALRSGRVEALSFRRARPLEEDAPLREAKEEQDGEEEAAQAPEAGRSFNPPPRTSAASSAIDRS